MPPTSINRRPRTLVAVAGLALVVLPGARAHARSDGNVASLAPSATATGPTVVHDGAFSGARTSVRSIDVPFTNLTLMVLEIADVPQVARNRVLGAHAHTKPCATDPLASGGHHINPTGDPSKPLAAREVWLDVRIDSLGRGVAVSLFDWRIRKGDAGSVVIHAEPTNQITGAAGARLLCTSISLGS
jgi:Cu-Zn family superoxide dismutase